MTAPNHPPGWAEIEPGQGKSFEALAHTSLILNRINQFATLALKLPDDGHGIRTDEEFERARAAIYRELKRIAIEP